MARQQQSIEGRAESAGLYVVFKRKREEASLQVRLMDYLGWTLPANAFAFHCPNGGSRNPIEAANLKRQGVKAGVPDIVIIHDGKVLGLELKSATGTLSASQNETFPKLRAAGMRIEVARTFDEAISLIREIGVHLKTKENIPWAVRDIFREAAKRRA